MPYVLAFRRLEGRRSVAADDLHGGGLVAAHLLDRGHRRLAVLGGPVGVPTVADRVAGFRAVAAERRPSATVQLVHTGLEADDGYQAAQQVLATPEPPTAIFAVNDFSAIGAIQAIEEAGLEVGRDVAVVGYNDAAVTARLHTPLSTVRTDLSAMGARAVRAVLNLGSEPEISDPELVVRASSDFWP